MADSKPQSYVEEMLTCSVCLDLVNEPRTLQNCFHSFCKKCVQQLLARQTETSPGVSCPVCCSFSTESEIRDNFFVNDLLQMHKCEQENKEGKKILCQQCVDDDPDIAVGEAHFKCLDCRISLCVRCHKSHLKVPILKRHRILPITEETELVIDRLVFCDIHDDEPVKFYCTECDQPICIQCKVTSHDLHKTETVDTALKRIIPEIEQNIQSLDDNLEIIVESINTVKSKISETDEIYQKISHKVKTKANTRIEHIKSAEEMLQLQLLTMKEQDIKKLHAVNEDLENKRKEEENMKRVAKTSIQRARHASLLTEIVQGGLKQNLQRHNQKLLKAITLETYFPTYQDDENVENASKQNGILGQIKFTSKREYLLRAKFEMESPRIWPVQPSFSEIFSKRMSKVFEISLNSFKSRMSVILGNIWVAETNNGQVGIYDTKGSFKDKILLENPRNVVKYQDNIFFATQNALYQSKSSEYRMLNKIFNGSFSDIYVYLGQIYVLENKQMKLMIFTSENDEWKLESAIKLQYPGKLDYHDSFLVCTTDTIYITAFNRGDCIYKFNKSGKLVKTIHSEHGEQYICGVDNQAHILVADRSLGCIKILNMEDNSWSTAMYPAGLDSVVDVILDTTEEQLHIWILQNDKLQKYAFTL